MSFPPCEECGAEYPEGKIGIVHKKNCTMSGVNRRLCLRCGCLIRKGQHRAYRFRPCEVRGAMQAYEIDQHFYPEDCMVALRRKEVEG